MREEGVRQGSEGGGGKGGGGGGGSEGEGSEGGVRVMHPVLV